MTTNKLEPVKEQTCVTGAVVMDLNIFFVCVTVKQEEHKLSILSSSGRSKHVVNVYDVSTGIDH